VSEPRRGRPPRRAREELPRATQDSKIYPRVKHGSQRGVRLQVRTWQRVYVGGLLADAEFIEDRRRERASKMV
jgi:hypothetical protein